MASRKSTNISLSILGIVSLGVVGYFAWIFLAPPPATSVVSETVATDIQTNIVNDNGFKLLQQYANLPIKATRVGRVNPFSPYDENVGPTTTMGEIKNLPKAPLIEEDLKSTPINTNTP